MSMLFSSQEPIRTSFTTSLLLYPDVAPHRTAVEIEPEPIEDGAPQATVQPAGPTAEEIDRLIAAARASAIHETEARLRADVERRDVERTASIAETVRDFAQERRRYFDRVESDVVHLALAIAAKILHREAQVDPMLVTALVRVAINKLHDGSAVTVRVAPSEAERWRASLTNLTNGSTVHLVEDPHVQPAGCILETDLGSADFSIDAQLKEVEQGFFDLLNKRPGAR